MHAVTGGDGPRLLLVHGWPETWRLLTRALARDSRSVAVEQRGMGLSDKPTVAHDTSIQAGDLALMDALGHWLKVTCDTHHRLAWLRPMKQPGEPEALGLGPCHET